MTAQARAALEQVRDEITEWLATDDCDGVAFLIRLKEKLDASLLSSSSPGQGEEKDPLAAPCQWCGYNGPSYWQAWTHAEWCPWRLISGERERRWHLPLVQPSASPSVDGKEKER